jgi:hypothetical protein
MSASAACTGCDAAGGYPRRGARGTPLKYLPLRSTFDVATCTTPPELRSKAGVGVAIRSRNQRSYRQSAASGRAVRFVGLGEERGSRAMRRDPDASIPRRLRRGTVGALQPVSRTWVSPVSRRAMPGQLALYLITRAAIPGGVLHCAAIPARGAGQVLVWHIRGVAALCLRAGRGCLRFRRCSRWQCRKPRGRMTDEVPPIL